jgi:hypothetical protein
MRNVVLVAVLAFIAVLTALTVDDIVVYGVSLVDIFSVGILVFFSIAIVGALLTKPPPE